MDVIFGSVPVGSLASLPPSERGQYINQLFSLPTTAQDMLFDAATGAYLRGLAKTSNLPVEDAVPLALFVLKIGMGQLNLSELAQSVATQFQLDPNQAQLIAREIERELFAPIMLDLRTYLQQQRPSGAPTISVVPSGGARNVLDLKKSPAPPLPPAIPR